MENGKVGWAFSPTTSASYLKFLLIFILFCTTISPCLCKKPKTMIIFNNEPITKTNLLDNSSEFQMGKKIYYLFITEKPLKTDAIRVRVMKRDSKALNEITKMVYSNDYRLYKDQIYYYNDYVVMHDVGEYCMVIFSKMDLRRPLAIGDFKVKWIWIWVALFKNICYNVITENDRH